MESLGTRLQHLRKNANLTQEEFGKQFGIAKNTVSQYERDLRVPNDELKMNICNHFHISMDYLLGLSDTPNNIEVSENEQSTESSTHSISDFDIIFENYNRLSNDNRKRLEEYLRMLLAYQNNKL